MAAQGIDACPSAALPSFAAPARLANHLGFYGHYTALQRQQQQFQQQLHHHHQQQLQQLHLLQQQQQQQPQLHPVQQQPQAQQRQRGADASTSGVGNLAVTFGRMAPPNGYHAEAANGNGGGGQFTREVGAPSSSLPEYLHSSRRYKQLGKLGEGTFGVVIKALDLKTDPPTYVAVKLLPRGDFVWPRAVRKFPMSSMTMIGLFWCTQRYGLSAVGTLKASMLGVCSKNPVSGPEVCPDFVCC